MAVDPESLPLRDRLRLAEKMVRELTEQLENTYLKNVRELQRVTSEGGPPVGDMTVRMGVARVLETDQATDALWKETRIAVQSIKDEFDRVLREGE